MKTIEEEPSLPVKSETPEIETLEGEISEIEALENHIGENDIPEEKRQIDEAGSILRRFIKMRTQKE